MSKIDEVVRSSSGKRVTVHAEGEWITFIENPRGSDGVEKVAVSKNYNNLFRFRRQVVKTHRQAAQKAFRSP